MEFLKDALRIDPAAMAEAIVDWLRAEVLGNLRRRGAVVAVSGGVDSAVAATLAARAFGPERVLGLILPEREVGEESERLAQSLLVGLGVSGIKEDLTLALEGLGCYRRRDEAICRVIPQFGEGWTSRIVLGHNPLESDGFNVFYLEVFSPGGQSLRRRLPLREYLDIVAATNMKQRSRMIMQYYHGERLRYAVVGTHNRTEYDLGFMVRHGDIGVDLHPLAGLFKVQIYQLADYLGVPEEILCRAPSSGTFPAPQTEQEFFFSLPFELLDPLLHAEATGVSVEEATTVLGIPLESGERIYRDIRSKRRFSEYMRRAPDVLNLGTSWGRSA
ncbi:MAG: NAD(+) synthase [Syntrophobacteraceae bacterium]|nr:NAD(+) synthase [Syntrophobacteraceae bacterium]